MQMRKAFGFFCSVALMLQSPGHYPARPVRIVEPFGAGGGVDVIARAVGQKLSELWDQPVTVELGNGARVLLSPAQAEWQGSGSLLADEFPILPSGSSCAVRHGQEPLGDRE